MKKEARHKSRNKKAVAKSSSSFLYNRNYHVAAIIIVGLILYFPTINYQLTYYDDATLIDNINRFIREGHPISAIFSQSVFGSSPGAADYYYRPLLTLSLYLNALIGGTSLTGFHLANIFIHIAAGILFYFFLTKLKFGSLLSFASALLFLVHPALVQSVAWIPGRNDSLLTMLALASMLFLIQYLEQKKIFSLLFHLLCFFLSLLTKETAILLPVLYFILIRIFQKHDQRKESSVRTSIPLAGIIVSWIGLGVFFFLIRRSVLGASVGLPLSFTLVNLFKNLPALIQYTGKILLPFNLSTFPILQDSTIIFGLITLIVLLYFLITSKKIRRNYLLLGICWLLLFLIPAILRTSSDYESVFLEHRLYFPLIGFLLVCMETDFVKNIHFENSIPKIVFGSILILFMVLSYYHSKDYKDELSYWTQGVKSSPHSSFAHRGLGTCLLTQGKSAEAKTEYETALHLNPDLKEIRNNLGRIYLNEGNEGKAEQLFNEELKMNPANAMAYYNLGLLRLNQKNVTAADSLIRKSLQLDPTYRDAQNDLCVILAMQKKYEEATQLCIKILGENPSYESAKKNLLLIFSAWNDSEKVKYYQNILLEKGIRLK